jgi:uncharacterized membrane protein YfcA
MLAIALGFVLGFLIGMTGVGGGALVAPALYVVLGLGYQEAVALSLVYAFVTKIISALQHARQGTVVWRITLLYGLCGVPGAVVGSYLMYAVGSSEAFLPYLLSAVLFVVSVLILVEGRQVGSKQKAKPFSPHEIGAREILTVLLIQTVVGLLLGVTSVGAGSLVIVSMLYLFRMSVKEVIGSNIFIALIMVVPAGLTHQLSGGLNWTLLGLLMTGSFAGAVLGPKVTVVASDRVLKTLIAVLVAVAGLLTAIKAWNA